MPGGGLEFACEKTKEQTEDLEHVMKTLQGLQTTDEKLTALCKKYAEMSEEHRTVQNTLKQTQRTLSVLAREKDQLQNDHSKAVLAKSKLEGLCRELQRHNRLVKDESAARAKEDDEKRKEVAVKFQTTINDIQQQMNDHYQKNTTLREENVELTNKLKGLIDQYELREQHVEKVLKHKELESQLQEAKMSQLQLQLSEEKEKNLHEKQQLLQDAVENQKKVMVLVENEKQLKAQVVMYQEKYDEFQQTLTKSNDVFQNFKNEMDKMTKKMRKLERETTMYRQRWESSNKALLQMAEEKTVAEKEVTSLQNKVSKLESLCRALQEERRKMLECNPPAVKQPATVDELQAEDKLENVATAEPVSADDNTESITSDSTDLAVAATDNSSSSEQPVDQPESETDNSPSHHTYDGQPESGTDTSPSHQEHDNQSDLVSESDTAYQPVGTVENSCEPSHVTVSEGDVQSEETA